MTISAFLTNPTSYAQPYVYIVQVKDSEGVVVFLTWRNGILLDEGQPIGMSWRPTTEGRSTYNLQTFLWTGIENPVSLKGYTSDFHVNMNGRNVASCTGDAHCYTATVTKIVDGDTIRVTGDTTIRLTLVNTPERGEFGYNGATDFTAEMCPVGSTVLVDEDDGQTEGSYGRMIAKVYCSDSGSDYDTSINEALLTSGHAIIYTDFCDDSEFARERWAQKYGCDEAQSSGQTIEEPQMPQMSIGELKQYALNSINEDRQKYGLPPVSMSNNIAAQAHADDLFKTRYHSTHWTSDGMKPYMKYTVYGGEGAVAQNVAAGQLYSDDDIERCKAGKAICEKVDVKKQTDDAEHSMMYEDKECCENGHRDDILDKYHTEVSIGIAYDDYYFAYVQNFENNYIDFNEPMEENRGYITFAGSLSSGKMYDIAIFYDEPPTVDTYDKFRDQTWYDNGELIASVVEPAPVGYQYEQPSNYTLIEARRWQVNGNSIDIALDISQFMERKAGVYTVVVLLEDENHDIFEATTHSFFKS